MINPWDNDRPFAPFFQDSVAITHNENRTSLKCAVYADMTGDPLAEQMDADRGDIQIVFSCGNWPYVKQLTRGDLVERADGRKYKISKATYDELFGWIVYARSI